MIIGSWAVMIANRIQNISFKFVFNPGSGRAGRGDRRPDPVGSTGFPHPNGCHQVGLPTAPSPPRHGAWARVPKAASSAGPTVGLSGGVLSGLRCPVQPGAHSGPGETLCRVLPPLSLGFVRLWAAAEDPSQVCVHSGSKCKACACPDTLASLTICPPPDPAGP